MVRGMKKPAESMAARLARARDYPYFVPDRSYTWRGGQRDATALAAFDPALAEGRTPVLAVGSNQSPQQLVRKYGDGDHAIPVQRATLHDFDVVYASHISIYGAVPAMLQHAPGVAVILFVTWLDDRQLAIMHRTEGNYHFAEIADIRLALEDGGGERDRVFLYVARLGHLMRDGGATGLRAVAAQGRRNGASTTADMLRHVQDRLGVAGDHDAFVLRLIEDESYRRECIERLSEGAVPFDYPFRIIEP